MCEVNQQDEPKEDEKHGSDEGEVSAPDLEESLWNQESQDDETKPDNYLRAPVTVL